MIVASHKTSQLSLVYALIDGECVISVFPIGANGEPNTDREEYFHAFGDGKIAALAYVRLEGALDHIERTGALPNFAMAQERRLIKQALYPDG